MDGLDTPPSHHKCITPGPRGRQGRRCRGVTHVRHLDALAAGSLYTGPDAGVGQLGSQQARHVLDLSPRAGRRDGREGVAEQRRRLLRQVVLSTGRVSQHSGWSGRTNGTRHSILVSTTSLTNSR